MNLEIGLTDEGPVNTSYAPLAVLGAHYQATGQLAFFTEGEFGQKRRVFSTGELLCQVLWSMLAGCETLGEVTGRLGGEQALASAEGWARFADQATLSRLLDRLSLKQIATLRAGMLTQMQMNSQVRQHDWRGYLWLDFDLSGLPCSAQAEESQKGYFSDKKNTTGRQLARVSASAYRETVYSDVYPDSKHTSHCLQPSVESTEIALELSPAQRQRTVWRIDGGSGSDAHVRWLLQRGYQVVAKGMNNRRAQALARQVQRWDVYRPDTWLGEVPPPVDYGRPVRVLVKRQLKEGATATVTTSAPWLCLPKGGGGPVP
ncbi:MAG: hypothetical protein M5U29_10085 [Anaerolineae bacterium]|nr:hypothetical protein [Anaerolineae bacterium]